MTVSGDPAMAHLYVEDPNTGERADPRVIGGDRYLEPLYKSFRATYGGVRREEV